MVVAVLPVVAVGVVVSLGRCGDGVGRSNVICGDAFWVSEWRDRNRMLHPKFDSIFYNEVPCWMLFYKKREYGIRTLTQVLLVWIIRSVI